MLSKCCVISHVLSSCPIPHQSRIHWLFHPNIILGQKYEFGTLSEKEIWIGFYARSQNCEKRLLASLCLSVRMEHLGSHWTDFYEIWYLRSLRKCVEKIQVSLIPHKYGVIRKSLRDFRPLQYSNRDGHAEGERVNRGRDTPSFCPTLQVLDMSTLGVAADVSPVIKFLPHTCIICGRKLITGLTSAESARFDISNTCKVRQKFGVPLPLLTCSPSPWSSRLLYRRGQKSRRDLWITLYRPIGASL